MTRHSFASRSVLIALGAISLLVGTLASAQTTARVRIPFAFTANHQNLPPGEYKLELLSDRFLRFTNNSKGKYQGVIMVQPEPAAYIESRSRLRFVVSDYRHYLTEIRFAGSSLHSAAVLQPSLARELAKHPAISSVEVAMR